MRKIIISFVLVLSTLLLSAQRPQLKFHDGTFKIMQLTDLHLIGTDSYKAKRDSTYNLIRHLIEVENPDLVVLTGDCVVWCNALAGWTELTNVFVEKQVPFAVAFGNHDEETDMNNAQILKFLETVPGNLTYDEADVSGSGNCSLPVYSSDGGEIKWVLYMLDSHNNRKDRTMGYYDWIQFDQIEWYRNMSDKYSSENKDNPVPSLAFFHIPFFEFETGKWAFGKYGEDLEGVCAPRVNSGLFNSFLEKRDVIGVFVGHDHNDDYLIDMGGRMCLAYGRKTGYTPAYKELLDRGCRIINLYENEFRFSTYIEDLKGQHYNYTFEQKNNGTEIAKIDGTFFQPYEAFDWDDERWDREMKVLQDAGMHYFIFAPVFKENSDGTSMACYRPCSFTGRKHQYDMVEKCLRSAQKHGIRVFLGLNFNDKWWSADFSEEWLYSQMEKGNDIAEELVALYKEKYRETMYGWYWIWEVDNLNVNTPEKEQILANAMNVNIDFLNSISPSMPFLFSPFVNYKTGMDKNNTVEMWKRILPKVHFRGGDIFCPQDCVGAGGLELEMQEEWMRSLSEAARKVEGLKFWVNVETFDQRYWSTAPLTRLVEQLKTANWSANNIICFAYYAYNSPCVVNPQYDSVYREYLKTGVLPDVPAPSKPAKLNAKIMKDGVKLSWTCTDMERTAGYNVYSNGELKKKIVRKTDRNSENIILRDVDAKAVFAVSAYNVLDKESERISIE